MSDFKFKMYPIRAPLELRPRPRWGAYSAAPDPLAVFNGPTSKGRGCREGIIREMEGKVKGRGFGSPKNFVVAPFMAVVTHGRKSEW